ncbi:LOW QUALITY PROTEIN: uncharacterized protein LOC121672459 [Corvus kubaryi]|uniref:LOW QUALITY PROTEIN: uncharacterized protein LOC121672459 n=1 Tax=Corvus kubaryi TaxID=68294 RepID=UPI001C059E5B|nr:LOW QUALITY PROTEIN: uncharacterized protein LOC121672459 [Corvus kubaryi]
MDLHLALSPALALPNLVAFKVQCPEPPSSGPSSAGGSRVPPVHEAARLPVGAYTMPDSWLSDVWHCCFVPVAVLNSFICTGLSCYSQHIWDEETGAGGFLLLRFLVVLVIPPVEAQSQGFRRVLAVGADRGLCPSTHSPFTNSLSWSVLRVARVLPEGGSHPPPHSSSAAAGVTVPGVKSWSGTATACSSCCSPASSSHLTCPRALCPAALTAPVSSNPPCPPLPWLLSPAPKAAPCSRSCTRIPSIHGCWPLSLAGHSHQLFHICSVLAPPLQLEAILCDVCMHQAWLWGHLSPTGIPNTSSTAGLALVGNTAIISALTVALPKTPGGPGRPPGVPTGAGHWRDPGHRVRGWAAEPGRTQHPGSFFVVDPAVGCLAMSLSPTSSLCTPTVP